MEKLHISRAIVVEGRYDKIKLSSIVDGVIIVTGGFGIYKSRETCRLIRRYAETTGLIVLTDSDRAGRQIRAHIKSILPKELHTRIAELHIPQIKGKERRKAEPSKEGTLGVEGIDADILRRLLEPFADEKPKQGEPVTKNDLFMLGLSGTPDASERRAALCQRLNLPSGLSPSALLDLLNTLYTREELTDLMNEE
ncbi:ribonuclease M5 [Ruminococcus sp. YE71]|uniref:toprim domain-containing protein n=1 Tax=unclassified Ruminococcus TaxID=2608920 RepID=UPI00088FB528|nr:MULTISPECIES: DUF4093 domain-containing protein [unclassified Ruminococcus]SDA15808.1 ribonuclease M5 [Ruminococcus sp. YE78]SFW23225.1 ribonuclease M5 [Ruminococcus sp. YE71]